MKINEFFFYNLNSKNFLTKKKNEKKAAEICTGKHKKASFIRESGTRVKPQIPAEIPVRLLGKSKTRMKVTESTARFAFSLLE